MLTQQHLPKATLKGIGRLSLGRPHDRSNERLTTAYVYSQRSARMFVYAVPAEWRNRNLQPAFDSQTMRAAPDSHLVRSLVSCLPVVLG